MNLRDKMGKLIPNKCTLLLIWPLMLFAVNAMAQQTVTGTVRDASSTETLPGVNILVKGTSTGASTDAGGQYELTVESLQDTLVVSFVGYQTQQVPINGRTKIDMTLHPEAISGEEMVVIGYGTQSRQTVTSSISTVNANDFNSGQVSDPIALIEGKIPGLTISNPNSGDPNSTTDFSLRGPATLQGNSQPLIVIDGVPGGDLQSVSPANISSIDVLKGGSAAAIYGSRAAAGVIIVKTKEGKKGETSVQYNGSISTQTAANSYNMLNADQYKQLAKEKGMKVYDGGGRTNWFNEVTRTPVSHSHNLSINGGNNTTTYHTSLTYRNSQGLDLIANRKFINGVLRLDTKALDDKLNFKFKIANSFNNRRYSQRGALAQSLSEFPTFPVKNSDGSYFEEPSVPYGVQWNPVANMYTNTNREEGKEFTGYGRAAYQIAPSLELSVSYSMQKNDHLYSSYSSSEDFFQMRNDVGGEASRSDDKYTSQDVDAVAHYKKSLANNNFDVTAGYSYHYLFSQGLSAGNNNFSTNAYGYYNLGAGKALNNLDPNAVRRASVGSYASDRTLRAFFGRLIYNYKSRYLLNLSVRRAGASVLGKDNKWGTFPGVSIGWRISNENFMNNVNLVQNLKLRAGYGVTGNQQSLNPYQSLPTIGSFYTGTQDAYFGKPGDSRWILPYGPTENANPDLRWETQKELDIGLDFSLLKNGWLSGSLDLYRRNVEHLVGNFSSQLPAQIFPTIFANAGNMINKGLELALSAEYKSKNFSWKTTLTGSYNKNEIISLSSEQYKGTAQDITNIIEGTPIQRLAEGHSVAAFYGRVFAGFTEDGKQWLFKNKEGESVRNSEIGEDDYAYLGNSIPRYNVGLSNSFNFGYFDVSFLFKSALDFNAVNAKKLYYGNSTRLGRNNLFKSALNNSIDAPPVFSSYYVEKGNYLKFKNLTVGYTLSPKIIGPFKKLRLYLTAENLATFTGFSGQDPELRINWNPVAEGAETSNGPGVEGLYDYYPSVRSFQFGINISL